MVRSRINEASFVVVATMGNGDEEGLQAVVGTTPRYLGLVASEKKARSLFEYLRDKGATDEEIARIKCPAGLELGGETMPEIALSVMAEITRVRREKSRTSGSESVTLPVMQGAHAAGHGRLRQRIQSAGWRLIRRTRDTLLCLTTRRFTSAASVVKRRSTIRRFRRLHSGDGNFTQRRKGGKDAKSNTHRLCVFASFAYLRNLRNLRILLCESSSQD